MKMEHSIKQEIVIRPCTNGNFIVQVGCCIRTYPNSDRGIHSMADDLMEYLSDPKKVEDEYKKLSQPNQITINPPSQYGMSRENSIISNIMT